MRKIDEAISRLQEVEGQLRAIKHSVEVCVQCGLTPELPEVLEKGLLAEDVMKARERLEEIRDGRSG